MKGKDYTVLNFSFLFFLAWGYGILRDWNGRLKEWVLITLGWLLVFSTDIRV